MKIKDLAQQLENEINSKVKDLQKLAKESEDIIARIDNINLEMYEIYKELKPIEYMVKHHNPDMVILFTSLKDMFEKKK